MLNVDDGPNIGEFASVVEAALIATYTGRAAYPAGNTYASSWQRCERRMALDVAVGHLRPDFDTDAKARMVRGDEREVDIRTRLERAGKKGGFTVEGAQERFEIKGNGALAGKVIMSGKTDGKLRLTRDFAVPFEVKSLAPHFVNRIRRLEDFARSMWTERIPFQMLAYLFGTQHRYGVLVLDRPGVPLLIWVDLFEHLEMAEDFLRKAEVATEAGLIYRELLEEGKGLGWEGILPDYRTDDPKYCRACDYFAGRCQPPEINPGIEVSLDAELWEAEETYWKTAEAAKEHDQAKERLKAWAKERKVATALVGDSRIIVRWDNKPATYAVPDEIRQQYVKAEAIPGGKAVVKIERVNPVEDDEEAGEVTE